MVSNYLPQFCCIPIHGQVRVGQSKKEGVASQHAVPLEKTKHSNANSLNTYKKSLCSEEDGKIQNEIIGRETDKSKGMCVSLLWMELVSLVCVSR